MSFKYNKVDFHNYATGKINGSKITGVLSKDRVKVLEFSTRNYSLVFGFFCCQTYFLEYFAYEKIVFYHYQ